MKPGEALVDGDTIQSMGSASSLPYLLVPCISTAVIIDVSLASCFSRPTSALGGLYLHAVEDLRLCCIREKNHIIRHEKCTLQTKDVKGQYAAAIGKWP